MNKIKQAWERAIKSEINIDYLTGLMNRRGFYEIWNTLSSDMHVHCAYIDVDNFKLVNDIYGHSRGDDLLVYVAHILGEEFARQIVVRMGGDEFVVLCEGEMTPDSLMESLHRLQCLIRENFDASLSALLSFSIGVTVDHPVSKGVSILLDQCDEAMYYVKKNGKGSCSCYEEIKDDLIEQKAMKNRALTAISENEIQVLVRPIVFMQTSDVFAVQVVAQWDFPGFGILPEDKFLPVFEQYGVSTLLDEFVFEQACKWKGQWKGTVFERITMYVRISSLYLMKSGGVAYLKECMKSHQLMAEDFKLCIDEKTFLMKNREIKDTIQELEEAGFDIAIQNFGSAASFLVLQQTQAHVLKLDRSLLPDCFEKEKEDKKEKILRNVISMGRDLRFLVVADDIQDASQIETLVNYGAQLGMGDFYGIAQPVEQFFAAYKSRYFFSANQESTCYRFQGNIQDEKNRYAGVYHGEGLTYTTGVTDEQGALCFPGGSIRNNLIELPKSTMYTDSYTVCLWVKTELPQYWTSIFYMVYENGFISLVPSDARGSCIFRIKDAREPNEWFDLFSCGAVPGEWAYLCISYDVLTGMAKLYFNGNLKNSRGHAPNLKVLKQIFIGGDDYQESYKGLLSGLEIHHRVLSEEEIEQKYQMCAESFSLSNTEK